MNAMSQRRRWWVTGGVLLTLGVSNPGWAQSRLNDEESPPESSEMSQDPQASEGSANTTSSATEASSTVSSTTAASPETTTTPSSDVATPSSNESASPSEPAPAPPSPAPEGMVNVDFKDADIRQVLRILSLKSGVDIVAGNNVEGLVTIKLTNVPWEQALDIILRTYGFTYERNGNIVRVLTVDALEKEALSTEVFPLDYAKAKEVPDVIKEMLSERGKVKFDERTNTVIVTDIPSSLFQIKKVMERLDQRTPQVLIETRVVETRLAKTETLGIDWSDSFTLAASAVSIPTTFPFPGGANFGTFGKMFIPRASTLSPGGSLTDGRIPQNGGTFTFGTLSSTGLSAVMNFLQSRTDTRILSNPSIAALNNHSAKVHIGSEYPVPTYSIDPTSGRTAITGYTPKSTGTVLTVTPHVNPSSEIVVDLKPEVVTVGDAITYNTGGGFSVSLPQFTTQTAETQVRIRGGDTIAIGGLVKETEIKSEAKVPFLGDLPLVGALFKNVSRNSGSDPSRQDLLIFLTVTLIEEGPPAGHAQAVAAVPAMDAAAQAQVR